MVFAVGGGPGWPPDTSLLVQLQALRTESFTFCPWEASLPGLFAEKGCQLG